MLTSTKRQGEYRIKDLEIWKNISGFIDYQVSNFGRIKSYKYKKKLLKGFFTGKSKKYLQIQLCKYGKTKNYKIHRLVYFAFNPSAKKTFEVHHIDKNTFNNRLENLIGLSKKEHGMIHTKEKIYINKIKDWDDLFKE